MSTHGPYLAEIAHLMGDPARANMLHALMDGRALTAKELAYLAGVAPQTASGHLAKLMQGGLLGVAAQGRHRYYRLASAEVATALEGLMVLAGTQPTNRRLPSRVGEELSRGRTCYDHFAGRLGIGIHDALVMGGHLNVADGGYGLRVSGEAVFAALGVDPALLRGRRAALRPCLDWSERKPHLAGSLAAALACRCFETGWVRRKKDSRAVVLTEEGRAALGAALPGFRCDEPEAVSPAVRAPETAFA
ncbi:DNA-binding transcriptional ArsR family regulator [Bosea sp. BE125]|uniref:ArsR/SmtB family transcription factor n=1 Tax=Bosea sp. BE125 TaxID=2817909 RepID=UPI00285AA932|nr:helix-turn-helix transcriptional regulator [Bosea sp. BE125]MDR6871233.1 DNA-binding transcriptional ArsR family regulator [Bosea sp. BE125]